MEMSKKIRLANLADSTSILEIYVPFIANTTITFECEIPTIEEFRNRMADIQKKYPWIVCEVDGNIVGYAYASQFNVRASYDWSADFSIYINPIYHRKNIGKALYFSLFEFLKLQGFYNIYSGVTLPNIKSESLHESFGFKEIGIYRKVGYKFDNWHDVKWYGMKIKEHGKPDSRPKTIDEIRNTPEFDMIIEKAEKMIHL